MVNFVNGASGKTYQPGLSAPMILALTANTKEIKPVCQYGKPCFIGNFLLHILEAVQIRINNSATLHAYDMGMGVGLITIIPVAAIWKTKFQNLSQGLDQKDGPIYSCKAHGRKVTLQLLIYGFHAGMAFTSGDNFHNSHALGGNLMIIIP